MDRLDPSLADPMPENNPEYWTSKWNFIDVILISITTIIVVLVGAWGIGFLFQLPANISSGLPLVYTAGLTALEALAIFIGVFIFGIQRKQMTWKDIGLRPSNPVWITLAVLTAIILIPLIGIVATWIQIALGQPVGNPQLAFLVPDKVNWVGILGMILFGGVVVPIAEEIYFRGLLYQWMRKFLKVWVAIPLSSLIFGLLHGDIAVAGATFIIGLILAWFYERSHSLYASIAIHIVNNTFSLVLLYALLVTGVQFPPTV